ncbi:MAG TPA: EscU/YscU/HrcU family type III secretion system export apparatus switch protein [Thermotogota bacterium]|nr:EscU/YscU/HrcU family type III secretion system export apparatus switch protein [Thermotogota bacterium]HRW91751.1 EscU/YscU/HrcU family type III secretion system export apparatus switch protein [Thermotogota bacterium]
MKERTKANPPDTHQVEQAAALRYDPEEQAIPRVIAQGKGELARRIVELAVEYDIPIYRDRALVEKLLELDYYSEIPPDLFKAVAQVIVYVYQLGGWKP